MPANRLVCQVMLHTGLRVGDAVALPLCKVKQNFSVTEAKTGKTRRVRLPAWLVAEIKAQAGPGPWAFPSPRDPSRHRSREAVWKDIKRAQRAFRLPINAGAHSMRKVYAVELMAKYGDIEKVRAVLDHKYVTTTMLYAMADKLTETAQQRPRRRRA